ncbi:MAG: hypothetical protein O8C66_07465 [Candidatus Methanoperedens sp.]|nr:hypothetical protein [Candidatus Methanoperedens sp.]
MKKIDNGVILLDGVDTLLAMNDLNNVLGFVQILNNTARITGSRVIISTSLEGEDLNRVKEGMEYIKA